MVILNSDSNSTLVSLNNNGVVGFGKHGDNGKLVSGNSDNGLVRYAQEDESSSAAAAAAATATAATTLYYSCGVPTDLLIEEEQEDEIDSTDSKLDLARAYIEMGDTDGARTLLAEIVNIGTPAQQIEAKELLLRVDTKSD